MVRGGLIVLSVRVDRYIVFEIQVDLPIVFDIQKHLSLVCSVEIDLFQAPTPETMEDNVDARNYGEMYTDIEKYGAIDLDSESMELSTRMPKTYLDIKKPWSDQPRL